MKKNITKSQMINLIKGKEINEQNNHEYTDDENDLKNYAHQRQDYHGGIQGTEGQVNYTGEYHNKMPIIKLKIPKVIDASTLVPTGSNANTAKYNMITINPRNGEREEGYAITDEVLETPNGRQLLLIKNYGVPGNNGFTYNYIDASNERHFFATLPIKKEYGILKTDKYKNTGKSEKEKVGYSKRLISSRINNVFNDSDLKYKLNSMLVANVVGDYRHTEMRTNVIRKMLWAVDSPKINVSYNGVIGVKKLEAALDYLTKKMSEMKGVNLNLIPDLDDDFLNDVFGTDDDEKDNKSNINLDKSTEYIPSKENNDETGEIIGQYKRRSGKDNTDYLTRAYPNVYPGGKWENKQRVLPASTFRNRGGLTPVRKLYPRDIQLGEIAVSSKSELQLIGDIVGDRTYSLTLKFDTDLAVRKANDTTGSVGNIIKPIEFTITKEIPQNIDINNMSLGDSTLDDVRVFFVGNDGIVTEALNKLSLTLLNEDSNMAMEKIMDIIAPQKKSINESNGNKKIKITEEQLMKLRQTINEEKFDEMISNFKRSQNDSIPVPHDELLMLFNITKDWCQKRHGDTDCEQLQSLRDNLNLY